MRIRLDYKDGITTFLTGLDKRLMDLRPFWRNYVAPYTYNLKETIFRTEGYNQWDPLDPEYERQKTFSHPGQTILRRNDVYYQAATGPGHADSVQDIDPLELVLGVTTEYAQYHEQGRGVPQRSVYALIPTLLSFDADITELAETYERDAIRLADRLVRTR